MQPSFLQAYLGLWQDPIWGPWICMLEVFSGSKFMPGWGGGGGGGATPWTLPAGPALVSMTTENVLEKPGQCSPQGRRPSEQAAHQTSSVVGSTWAKMEIPRNPLGDWDLHCWYGGSRNLCIGWMCPPSPSFLGFVCLYFFFFFFIP